MDAFFPGNHLFPSLVIASALLVAGCGDDGGGSNAVNVGESQPVNLSLDSFRVTENLEWTVYQPFFRAITPHSGDAGQAEAAAVVADIGRVMTSFIHWNNSNGETAVGYTSVRNPIDLMTHVLYSDQVGNFGDGRVSIGQAIDAGDPARYRNDQIVFTTEEQTAQGEKLSPWRYILAWVYVTEAQGDDPTAKDSEEIFGREISNAVIRVILSTNAPGAQITIFPAPEFLTSGPQTTPDARITSFTLPVTPSEQDPQPVNPAATLNQSWVEHEDLWTWTSEEAEMFGSTGGVRCAHLRVRYDLNRADLYTSTEPSRVGLDSAEPDIAGDGDGSGENPRCGALDANGEYLPAALSWALDDGNAPER